MNEKVIAGECSRMDNHSHFSCQQLGVSGPICGDMQVFYFTNVT